MHFKSSVSKPFIVEAGELFKIRYNFQSPLWEFWAEAMEAFTDVNRLVEAFSLVQRVL